MSPQLLSFLNIFIQIIQLLFLARLVAQLIDRTGSNRITRTLVEVTDPILAPIRRLMPSTGMVDFSPTVVLILLFLLQRFLASSV